MDEWAETLAGRCGRPVIDKTGVTGNSPPMDRALSEELGLKVEAGKGPVRMLIIDHIDKPSEN
jgi:hypothetical protein